MNADSVTDFSAEAQLRRMSPELPSAPSGSFLTAAIMLAGVIAIAYGASWIAAWALPVFHVPAAVVAQISGWIGGASFVALGWVTHAKYKS